MDSMTFFNRFIETNAGTYVLAFGSLAGGNLSMG
jgi:hypothetical protein